MAAEGVVSTPQLAVSVIPVRPGPDKTLEVFIQHRAATMDFAADVVVFPGGRVSPEDHEAGAEQQLALQVLDRHTRAWARTSIAAVEDSATREMCRVLLRCCQREVHEETGWRLVVEDLIPWANWVTPPDLPKRFDTFFFVAAAAHSDMLRHNTTEAEHSEWRSVSSLLVDYSAGRIRLMRPTLALLEELSRVPTTTVSTAAPMGEITPNRPWRAQSY
jgi:8-oxo-dGTP pyrophosphatase MutT (NUDIX family)